MRFFLFKPITISVIDMRCDFCDIYKMNALFKKLVLLVLVLQLVGCVSNMKDPHQSRASEKTPQSCKEFTQRFYDWYSSVSSIEAKLSPSQVAIKDKKELFDSNIIRLLQEDFTAQEKSADEIIGLDIDPFSNSQELCTKYFVVNSRLNGNRCTTDVRCEDKDLEKRHQPNVSPELLFQNGSWYFVDFDYKKAKSSLLKTLKTLREDRNK